MSFLNKLKQAVGVGTVKAEIRVPDRVMLESGEIPGEILVTCESAQKIIRLTIQLMEEHSRGSGEDKETKKKELGRLQDTAHIDLKAGETRTIPFMLPFKIELSGNRANARKGGVTGTVAQFLSFVQSENVKHEVVVQLDVAGAALDVVARTPVHIE